MEYLPDALARLAGQPDAAAAADQLSKEPMFCMETAIKLFYWMRLACEWLSSWMGPHLGCRPTFFWLSSNCPHVCLSSAAACRSLPPAPCCTWRLAAPYLRYFAGWYDDALALPRP